MSSHFKLSELEGAAVQSALDRLSARAGYRLSLNGLYNKWSMFVTEIERGYPDTIYEYSNSLGVRDILEELCGGVPKSAGDVITRALIPIDDRYERATRPSSKPIVAGAGDRSPRWFRIPIILSDNLKSDIESEMRD